MRNTSNNNFILSIYCLLCINHYACQSNNDNIYSYELSYYDNGMLESLSKKSNDSVYFTMHFSKAGNLEFLGASSILKFPKSDKEYQLPFDMIKKVKNNLSIDSTTTGDAINILLCDNNSKIPWVSSDSFCYFSIAHGDDLPHMFPFNDTADFIEYIDSTFMIFAETNQDSKNARSLYNIDTFLIYINWHLNHLIEDEIKIAESKSKLQNFSPLYMHEHYTDRPSNFKYMHKFLLHENIYHKILINWGERVSYGYYVESYYDISDTLPIENERFKITRWDIDSANCVDISVTFKDTGTYHFNITQVLPFKGVDIFSEDNNTPFMTTTTNDQTIKVLPK